jgi:hypothetical protein
MTDSATIRLFTGKIIVPLKNLFSEECPMHKRKGCFCRQTAAGEYLFRMIQVQLLDCGTHYQSNQECLSVEYETRPSELLFV